MKLGVEIGAELTCCYCGHSEFYSIENAQCSFMCKCCHKYNSVKWQIIAETRRV